MKYIIDTEAGTVRPFEVETTDPAYATQYLDQPWPHLIQHSGLQIMAKAPIAAAWKPGQSDYIFGRAPAFVEDGANGDTFDPPRPLRSPLGFPVVYIQDKPVTVYDGRTFDSDAQVLDYMERVDARAAALAKGNGWQQVWDAYKSRR